MERILTGFFAITGFVLCWFAAVFLIGLMGRGPEYTMTKLEIAREAIGLSGMLVWMILATLITFFFLDSFGFRGSATAASFIATCVFFGSVLYADKWWERRKRERLERIWREARKKTPQKGSKRRLK